MVGDESVYARDKETPEECHQRNYCPKVRLKTCLGRTTWQDAPTRTFSQPSNIDNANVDSNNMRQRQMKCLTVDFGGLYTKARSFAKMAPSSLCVVVAMVKWGFPMFASWFGEAGHGPGSGPGGVPLPYFVYRPETRPYKTVGIRDSDLVLDADVRKLIKWLRKERQ